MAATNASSFLSVAELDRLVAEGYISRREHPNANWELFIYNYSPKAQFARLWTPETLACRGLILDADYNVVARPFTKFFNYGEVVTTANPGDGFEVLEKLDGSLGIAYRDPEFGNIHIATRGAFASDQALWATRWWRENCSDIDIPRGETWLFEIIYPANRIVVDYGTRSELVLLAVIDNATGRDLSLPPSSPFGAGVDDGCYWPHSRAQRFDFHTLDELNMRDVTSNFEGYVVRYYTTGYRVKVKLDEYVRLHRLLTQVSSKSIWELLSNDQSLDDIIDRVPDEFYTWVRNTADDLCGKFEAMESLARAAFEELHVEGEPRKTTALKFQRHAPALCPILFKILDGKDYDELIWKAIKPEYEKPFVQQFETSA